MTVGAQAHHPLSAIGEKEMDNSIQLVRRIETLFV